MPSRYVASSALPAVSQGLADLLAEARESLETFDDVKMPVIRFKDGGFVLQEGDEPEDEIRGIILYTKQNNVFFTNAYKPGVAAQPDCFSPDGKIPTVEKPVAPRCKGCPKNEYGTSRTGAGKACRNIRLVFLLLEGEILPRVLRIPPTSLKLIDSYVLNKTSDSGSYFNVITSVTSFKRDPAQTHFNMKFTDVGRVDGQTKADMRAVRDLWLAQMKNALPAYDDDEAEPEHTEEARGTTTVEDDPVPAGREF